MGGIRQYWRSLLLWLIVMFLLGVAAVNSRDGSIVFLLPAAAGILTFLIPRFLREAESRPPALESRQKAKRNEADRIERLIESLDEDEIIELETLLLAREGSALRHDE